MTPAINIAKKKKIAHSIHQYEHDPGHPSYGMEAVEKLGLNPASVFKTLVVNVDQKELVVAVLPVESQLSMKLIAKAAGGKKAEMADKDRVQKLTGYVLGGVSPLGQKKRLKTVIDSSAEQLEQMYVSAGRRGVEISLSPADLQQMTGALFCSVAAES